LYKKLSKITNVEYDDGGAIGKRYRRQDEIGTPYCLTVDHASVETGMVTIRHRDSMEQITMHSDEVLMWMKEQITN
jgi:glycyl-tRNA synthetase